jgi:hypothetical protein
MRQFGKTVGLDDRQSFFVYLFFLVLERSDPKLFDHILIRTDSLAIG